MMAKQIFWPVLFVLGGGVGYCFFEMQATGAVNDKALDDAIALYQHRSGR